MGRPGFPFKNKLYVFMVANMTIINLLITSRCLGEEAEAGSLVYNHLTVATADSIIKL